MDITSDHGAAITFPWFEWAKLCKAQTMCEVEGYEVPLETCSVENASSFLTFRNLRTSTRVDGDRADV